MSTQMTATELNKLKKTELIERSIKLQHEHSELTELVATLENDETGLRDRVIKLQDEKSEFEGRVADLKGEKELLERKYGELFLLVPVSSCALTINDKERRNGSSRLTNVQHPRRAFA